MKTQKLYETQQINIARFSSQSKTVDIRFSLRKKSEAVVGSIFEFNFVMFLSTSLSTGTSTHIEFKLPYMHRG